MARPLQKADVLFRQRLLKSSGLYPGEIDGLWGPKTDAAEVAFERAYFDLRSTLGATDPRSEKVLATLQPAAQKLMRCLLASLAGHGWKVQAISGTRTYAEQAALYAQGRTAPGKIVTNAKAGESNHNWGIAIDIGVFTGSGAYLRGNTPQEVKVYRELGAIGREIEGLSWGGDWKKPDNPHYELRTGLDPKEARRRFERGEPLITA